MVNTKGSNFKNRREKLLNCKKQLVELKSKNFCGSKKRTQKIANYVIERRKVQATKSIEVDALVHGAEEGRDKLR